MHPRHSVHPLTPAPALYALFWVCLGRVFGEWDHLPLLLLVSTLQVVSQTFETDADFISETSLPDLLEAGHSTLAKCLLRL